jgi:hypothetical protein
MGRHNVFNKGLHPALESRPRVFISHRLADKPFAREIAAYFETIGLHYYFDEQDKAEYLPIYPQLWSAANLFGWVSEFTPWRCLLVAEQYSEYRNDIFGELDPDEDTVDDWQRTAERINDGWLARLERTFATDVA